MSAANTDEVLIKLEAKFQSEITEFQSVALKKISELKLKLLQLKRILVFTWNDELISQSSMLSSGDQFVPVIVKMSEYTKKKREKIQWYSDPFYSHRKGYRMCLCVDVANSWPYSGSNLSVWLYLLKGSYDDQLEWPLKGHCEVKLLNQISNSEHHYRE